MAKAVKISIAFLILLLFCGHNVFSETTISVIGRGATKDLAVKDALNHALEKTASIYLYSVTDVSNQKLLKDQILSTKQGYVKDYKIVYEKDYGDIIVVTVDVKIDDDSIKNIVHENLKHTTYEEIEKDYNLVTQKIEKLKASARLLKAISSRGLDEMYQIDYAGYEIRDTGLEGGTVGYLYVRVAQNPFYWDTYEEILQLASDSNENHGVCGRQTGPFLYKIHRDLNNFTVRARMGILKLVLPNSSAFKYKIILFKNFMAVDLPVGQSISKDTDDGYIEFYILPTHNQLPPPDDTQHWQPFPGECYFTEALSEEDSTCFVLGSSGYSCAVDNNDKIHGDNSHDFPPEGKIFKFPFGIKDPELIKSLNKIKIKISDEMIVNIR